MTRRNYYVVLDVPRDESPSGIRAAYLDLARQHHPDRAGSEGTRVLQEINEAYETLSDPRKRRAYNQELDLRELQSRRADVMCGRWRPSEPLAPEPISIQPEQTVPSFSELYDRILRNYTGHGISKGERLEPLHFEIVLTREEALQGVELPISVRTFVECPRCRGRGNLWGLPCVDCNRQGLLERHEAVPIRIPAGVRPGTVIRLPLSGLGIGNFYLRAYADVDDS